MQCGHVVQWMFEALYELNQVSVNNRNGRLALDSINLRIEHGERVVILGANGSGKSTLLHMLNALILPDSGECKVEGMRINRKTLQNRQWERGFRRRVALMFQQPEAMLFNPTVEEEIRYGLRDDPTASRSDRVLQWARWLGLENCLENSPWELSGGEKQRLCLACLLAPAPEVLLLDEPTANLDPKTAGWLLDWLRDRSLTTVVATHHIGWTAELGDRVIVIGEDHRISFDGLAKEVLADRNLLLANNLTF